MRLGFERLSYFAREEMGKNLDVGDVFLFLGHNRRRLKGLTFDGSGLILLVLSSPFRYIFLLSTVSTPLGISSILSIPHIMGNQKKINSKQQQVAEKLLQLVKALF